MRRICAYCGEEISFGFTTDDGDIFCCDECFESYMNELYGEGNWGDTEDDGENGYYEYTVDGGRTWYGTGIYWTEFEED